jgi:tetratricopeptide (TPR) repeat protein
VNFGEVKNPVYLPTALASLSPLLTLFNLTMLKITPLAFGLLLIAIIPPSSKAAMNPQIKSQQQLELFAEWGNNGSIAQTQHQIEYILQQQREQQRREQQQREQENRVRSIPQQIKQLQEQHEAFQRQQLQAYKQANIERIQRIVFNLEQKGDYIGIGFYKERKGDFAGAFTAYEKAISINQNPSEAYRYRGRLKEVQNDLTGAIDDYNQSILLDPQNTLAYIGRSELRKKLNDPSGARQDADQVLLLVKDLPSLPGMYKNPFRNIEIPKN